MSQPLTWTQKRGEADTVPALWALAPTGPDVLSYMAGEGGKLEQGTVSLLSVSIREQARAAAWDHSSGRWGGGVVDGPPELLYEHCPTPTTTAPVSVGPPGLRLVGSPEAKG